ncbi:MAG: hypothetical protein ACREL5_03615 [Gemmatimonadales bacterium]
MRATSLFSARRFGRLVIALAPIAVLGAIASCSVKGPAYFMGLGLDVTGDIGVSLTGIPSGTNVRLSGNGVDLTKLVDGSATFSGVPYGSYGLDVVNLPTGYGCDSTHADVTLSSTMQHVDAAFYCYQLPGQISIGVTGLLDGTTATVNYTGPENGSTTVGSTEPVVLAVPTGTFDFVVVQPTNYLCTGGGSVTVEPGGTASVQFQCTQQPGALSVTVIGGTAAVAYSGPQSGGGNVGGTPVAFGNLTPGSYTVSVTNPPNLDCQPHSTTATVPANDTAFVAFECQPALGIISVTVNGATAQVDFTGPQMGGSAVTGTVVFASLVAGTYTFNITNPPNVSCDPVSHDVMLAAGDSVGVVFDCSQVMQQPLTVGIDLAHFLGAPGAVPPGDYTRNLLDGNTVVGNIWMTTLGSDFWGTSPDRLGTSPGDGWRLDLGFKVSNQDVNVVGVGVCPLNAAVSAQHDVRVLFRDAALNVLGEYHITSTACAYSMVPAGTVKLDVIGIDNGFTDFNNFTIMYVPQ